MTIVSKSRRLLRVPALCLVLLLAAAACSSQTTGPDHGGQAARDVVDETLTVACGRCVFGMDVKGCPWAAKVDGGYYLVQGATPPEDEHDAHASDGMCNAPRKAVVRGRLENGVLTATEMRLLP